MNDADSLEQIVNKFHDALDAAKNNYNVHDSGKDAGNGQKNNADGTAASYSFTDKIYLGMSESEREEILRKSFVSTIQMKEGLIDTKQIEI